MSGTFVSLPIIGPVILQPSRMMGTLVPDVVIEERHTDRLTVTQHPVELGAEISDHAYRNSFEVSLRYGWSNAILPSTLGGIASAIEKFGSGEFNVQIVYEKLQALQQLREPFTLITGKRIYKNMMLTEIEVTTDGHSEYNLMVSAYCREVIIVTTQSAKMAPAEDHAQPNNTLPATDRGPVQASPVVAGSAAGNVGGAAGGGSSGPTDIAGLAAQSGAATPIAAPEAPPFISIAGG